MGRLVGIFIAPEKAGPLRELQEVNALAGKGLEGDRYCSGQGTFSKGDPSNEVTLIEVEALQALERDYEVKLTPAETRRNLLTEGVALSHLVGRDFQVGDVAMRGIRLCEPCGHLEKLTVKDVEKGLRHRGGLRAQVIADGTIRVGDTVG